MIRREVVAVGHELRVELYPHSAYVVLADSVTGKPNPRSGLCRSRAGGLGLTEPLTVAGVMRAFASGLTFKDIAEQLAKEKGVESVRLWTKPAEMEVRCRRRRTREAGLFLTRGAVDRYQR
jgi:hypothetical protein